MKALNLILFIAVAFIFFGCAQKSKNLLQYDQNTSHYVQNIQDLHVDMSTYNSRYFMPWNISQIGLAKDKARWANFVFKKDGIYYGENLQNWEIEDIEKIISNTNFQEFNKYKAYAITTKTTQTRNLPTNKPFFKDPKLGGEGYPFDYMQNALLHVNTPLILSHYSADGAWVFVQSSVSSGWLSIDSVSTLNAQERLHFKNSKKLVIKKDNTPLYTNQGGYALHAKLGAVFPLLDEDEDFFYSYVFNDRKPLYIKILKSIAGYLPLKFNEKNLSEISSELLGEKYGWGGFSNNRDCSAMTKDMLGAFGVWLPRNSFGQKLSGDYISFEGMSYKEKEEMILKNGIAFLSLIYMRGHVMLYAGDLDGKAMVMHNIWGLKTKDDGRIIIGKAVISDMYLGKKQDNVDKNALLIAKAEGIVIKPSMPPYFNHAFVRAYRSINKLEQNKIYFKDGSTLEYHDYKEKSFADLLQKPTPKDTLSLDYPAFDEINPPKNNYDPGRFRNEQLLKKLYGNHKKEIQENLKSLTWVDGTKLHFNTKQNAAVQLQKVIDSLKTLPKKYDKYLHGIAGTYNHRYIADTQRLSAHSFGIAIDLNVKESNYWKWDKKYKYQNKLPKIIVDTFERYGFIWGGRWYHYDTMHFEYRPELFDSID